MTSILSKADYLKKYLSQDDAKQTTKSRKIKKKPKAVLSKPSTRFQIIDADANPFEAITTQSDDDEELLPAVEVVDERPRSLQEIEKFRQSEKWKQVASSAGELRQSKPRRRHDSSASGSSNDDDDGPQAQRQRHDSSSPEPSTSRGGNLANADLSPPRKTSSKSAAASKDLSPPRAKRARAGSPDGDLSPPRAARKASFDASRVKPEPPSPDSDQSPPRRGNGRDSDLSPPRSSKRHRDEDLSPPRHPRGTRDAQSKSSGDRRVELSKIKRELPDDLLADKDSRMQKTLSGAKAGLQHASAMRDELAALRRREDEEFAQLGEEFSGRGAAPRVREGVRPKDRRKKEPTEEDKRRMAAMEEKYQKWNKGLKQKEMMEQRVADVLHEIDKPVARSKDDVDMNAMLREQELKEDPMFEYMQKKKAKKDKAEGKLVFPKYKGPMPAPNRYGIEPGYRWDGVDRSNGFETKFMSQSNLKKADDEEYFKWTYGTYE